MEAVERDPRPDPRVAPLRLYISLYIYIIICMFDSLSLSIYIYIMYYTIMLYIYIYICHKASPWHHLAPIIKASWAEKTSRCCMCRNDNYNNSNNISNNDSHTIVL